MSKSDRLTSRAYWQSQGKSFSVSKISKDFLFFDLFKKHLPVDKKMSCIEIGCIPGGFLVAMNKNFKYSIHGLDFNNLDLTKKNLEFNGIKNFNLVQEDILKFNPKNKFDVVCSFGFIEHFTDPEKYIQKMISLTKKNGFFIMGLPNFRYFQYITHYILDNSTLNKHYIDIMDTKKIHNLTKKYGVSPLHNDYYEAFAYTHLNKNIFMRILNAPLVLVSLLFNKFWKKNFKNTQYVSKYFSPYMIYIGKKLD